MMFGRGFGTKLGMAGDILTGNPVTQNRLQQQALEQIKQQQVGIDAYKAQHPEDPALIRSLQAAGIDPRSADGQQLVRNNLSATHYLTLGSPETGQMVVNPSAMAAPSAPPADAVSRLRSNPAEASQFDEIFGQGAAQRALGGQ